jgi:uncharacterized protein YecT (DUF1311 family)
MTADDPNGRPPPRFDGFRSYADDTPRSEGQDHALDYAYVRPQARAEFDPDRRFQFEDVRAPADASPARRIPPWAKALAIGGVALAVGGGLWLGRSTEAPGRGPASIAQDGRPANANVPQMSVEVAKAQPTPVPPPSAVDRLEVLPPADGRSEPQPARLALPMAPPTSTSPPPPERSAPPAPAEQPLQVRPAPPEAPPELALAPPARDATARSPEGRASLDCRDGPSRARTMVCRDDGLAALDRRMKRAYAEAVAAGTPANALREDQDDWMDIREDAARYSRNAVANVYRQRIAELERLAEDQH